MARGFQQTLHTANDHLGVNDQLLFTTEVSQEVFIYVLCGGNFLNKTAFKDCTEKQLTQHRCYRRMEGQVSWFIRSTALFSI